MAALLICNTALKRLPVRGGPKQIDYAGAAAADAGDRRAGAGDDLAGSGVSWASPQIGGLLALAAVLVVLLVLQERHAADPLLPPRLFTQQRIRDRQRHRLPDGRGLGRRDDFLPLFLQVVIGATASNSGLLIRR